MNHFARRQGAAEPQAARKLQQEGLEMYEFQEDRIRRTAVEAEMLFSEGKARVERVLNDSRNQEQQEVERMREETRSFVAHKSNAY